MKNFTILSFLLLAFLVSGCREDSDLPNAIYIPKEGGTFVVTDSENGFNDISISNYDGESVRAEQDSELDPGDEITANVATATFDWLTATAIYSEWKIMIKAEPNTTGKHRTLYVDVSIYDSIHSIKVRQKG